MYSQNLRSSYTIFVHVYAHIFFDIGQINSEKTIKQAKKLVCVPKQSYLCIVKTRIP